MLVGLYGTNKDGNDAFVGKLQNWFVASSDAAGLKQGMSPFGHGSSGKPPEVMHVIIPEGSEVVLKEPLSGHGGYLYEAHLEAHLYRLAQFVEIPRRYLKWRSGCVSGSMQHSRRIIRPPRQGFHSKRIR